MEIKLTTITEDPVMEIAKIASISHGKDPEELTQEDAAKLVRKLRRHGHGSTLEFAHATFRVDDMSRSMLAQITRHRHANFMVQSHRYTAISGAKFMLPDSIAKLNERETEDLYRNVTEHIAGSRELYEEMRDKGVPKEDARYIAPIGITTSMYVGANMREWRHIIDERGLNPHAQWEVRGFAQSVLETLYEKAEPVFEDQMKEYNEDFLRGGE